MHHARRKREIVTKLVAKPQRKGPMEDVDADETITLKVPLKE
jgi:hypothetical protein